MSDTADGSAHHQPVDSLTAAPASASRSQGSPGRPSPLVASHWSPQPGMKNKMHKTKPLPAIRRPTPRPPTGTALDHVDGVLGRRGAEPNGQRSNAQNQADLRTLAHVTDVRCLLPRVDMQRISTVRHWLAVHAALRL
jgi:hypothetical protein